MLLIVIISIVSFGIFDFNTEISEKEKQTEEHEKVKTESFQLDTVTIEKNKEMYITSKNIVKNDDGELEHGHIYFKGKWELAGGFEFKDDEEYGTTLIFTPDEKTIQSLPSDKNGNRITTITILNPKFAKELLKEEKGQANVVLVDYQLEYVDGEVVAKAMMIPPYVD